jgi:hypothetical protein
LNNQGARIVSSSNRIESLGELASFVIDFYESQKRPILFLSSGLNGRGVDEGDYHYVNFLIDKKTVIKYSIPASIRTSSNLWLGIGPGFAPMEYLLTEKEIFSGEATREAITNNLKMLDEYLAGRLT